MILVAHLCQQTAYQYKMTVLQSRKQKPLVKTRLAVEEHNLTLHLTRMVLSKLQIFRLRTRNLQFSMTS